MKVTAEVDFGDELRDTIEEVVSSAIDDVDFADKLSDALGYGNDPTDHYDMSDYASEHDVETLAERVATLERTLQQVAGLLMGTMTATPVLPPPSPTQGE